MIEKFESNKWYVYKGKKNYSEPGWNDRGMNFCLDRKPHQCKIGDDTKASFHNSSKYKQKWYWRHTMSDWYEVTGEEIPKSKPEKLIRYMVYNLHEGNTSLIFETEEEMKTKLEKFRENDLWKGRIIGYKLIPLYEVDARIKITKLSE